MSLEVLHFINTHPNWEDILSSPPYNIIIKWKEPFVLLKYNSLDSDMSNNIVQECRGLILKKIGDGFEIASMRFKKFFNHGEDKAAKLDLSKPVLVSQKVDGCFPYRTQILLENGKTMSIGKIVSQKISARVLTYNFKTNKIEPKNIINWSKKTCNKREWLNIKCQGASNNIYSHRTTNKNLQVTKNHIFFKKEKDKIVETPAKELKVGDILYTPIESLTHTQKQIILGGLLGDMSIINNLYKSNQVGVVTRHSIKQKDYCKFLKEKLGRLCSRYKEYEVTNSYGKEKVEICTYSTRAIAKLYDICYKDNKKNVTQDWLNQLDWLGIAIWYMDDGNLIKSNKNNMLALHTEGFSLDENKIIQKWFDSKGIKSYIRHYKTYYFIVISAKGSEYVWNKIRGYIPECMQYKLPNRHKGFFNFTEDNNQNFELFESVILDIKEECIYYKLNGGMCKFDIQVEDNSNYFADGILVHNSLIGVWYDEDTGWHVSTSGNIDARDSELQFQTDKLHTYYDLFMEAFNKYNLSFDMLDKRYTTYYELVSPYNRVVVPYKETKLYWLGARDNQTLKEYNFEDIPKHLTDVPKYYECSSIEEIKTKVDNMSTEDEHFEGFVIEDCRGERIKLKSPSYMNLFFIKGDGIFSEKKILKIILEEEDDDILAYFPEYKPDFDRIRRLLSIYITNIKKSLKEAKNKLKLDRKEYAKWASKQINPYVLFKFYDIKDWDENWLKEQIEAININKLLNNIKEEKEI